MYKKILFSIITLMAASSALPAMGLSDFTHEIPDIQVEDGFKKIDDVAQYGHADWDNVVDFARRISLSEAKRIAQVNPEITYFFYVKGSRMILSNNQGSNYVFFYGDVVFFKGEPWWGSAPDLADGYVKE